MDCCYMTRECTSACRAYYFDGVTSTCRRLSALEALVTSEIIGDEYGFDGEGTA